MIELTKLHEGKFVVNSDMIETLEATPDTVMTLNNGKIYIVKESPERIIDLIVAFRRRFYEKPVIKTYNPGDEEE